VRWWAVVGLLLSMLATIVPLSSPHHRQALILRLLES
jgi:hypothetical protein